MTKQAGNSPGANGTTDQEIGPPSLPVKKSHRMKNETERTFRDLRIGELFGPVKSATGTRGLI